VVAIDGSGTGVSMIVFELLLSNFIIGLMGGLIFYVLFLSVRVVVGVVMFAIEGVRFISRRRIPK